MYINQLLLTVLTIRVRDLLRLPAHPLRLARDHRAQVAHGQRDGEVDGLEHLHDEEVPNQNGYDKD